MMNDAGKILLTPKGKYNSLTEYEFLDCITYDGNAYVARKTTIGNLPTDGEYWCLLIENAEITPTFTIAQNLEGLKSGERYQITFGKIAKAVKDYILHKIAKATNTELGHVKVTNSAAVTDSTGLALAATEKNAALEGTLANLISQQNSNLYYKVGDVIKYTYGLWTCGTLTGGNKEVWFTIPLDKPILGSPEVKIIPRELAVRQNGTYLVNNIGNANDFITSGLEVQDSTRRVYGTGITVKIMNSNTDGFGGTNNDAVGVYFACDIMFI